jgi:hypothetical protein
MTTRKRTVMQGQKHFSLGAIVKKHRSMVVSVLIAAAIVVCSISLVSSAPILDTPTQNVQSLIEYTVQSLSAKNQFDCDVVYAYLGKGGSEPTHSEFGKPMYPTSQYPSIIYFNITHTSNTAIESSDIQQEVYLLQISTDKGLSENYTYVEGTNYKIANADSKLLTSMTSHVSDLVDINTIEGRGGHFRFNWTTGVSIKGGFVGSLGTYTSQPSRSGLWSNGTPDSISITVRRIGWIVANGSSILTFANTARDENIIQIQLQRFGEGFLYDKIVTMEQMQQIDPFKPPIAMGE